MLGPALGAPFQLAHPELSPTFSGILLKPWPCKQGSLLSTGTSGNHLRSSSYPCLAWAIGLAVAVAVERRSLPQQKIHHESCILRIFSLLPAKECTRALWVYILDSFQRSRQGYGRAADTMGPAPATELSQTEIIM